MTVVTEPAVIAPFSHAAVVTPNDGADLPAPGFAQALWVGGAGTITLDTTGGENSVLISGIPAGTLLLIRCSRVRAAGTSATLIIQLW